MDKLTFLIENQFITRELRLRLFTIIQSIKRGDIKYISINYHQKGVTISINPNKFLHGNNLQILSFNEIPEFLDKVSKFLNYNVETAIITGIDLCLNIYTEFPPIEYLRIIGFDNDIYRKQILDFEKYFLNFHNGLTSITVYDKFKEMKYSKYPYNYLRLEIGYNKRLKENILKEKYTLVRDLRYRKIYTDLYKNFEKRLENMNIRKKYKINDTDEETPLSNYLLITIIKNTGYDEAMAILKAYYENKSRQAKAKQLKKFENEIINTTIISDLGNELESKIKRKLETIYNDIENSLLPAKPQNIFSMN